MKKTIILIMAAASVCLYAACTKNENPVSRTEPRELRLTVSADDMAKTSLSLDGSTYKRAWRSGDALSVIYFDAGNNPHNEKFTLVEGAGSTTATFACPASEIPATQYDIKIVYPYMDDEYASSWWAYSIALQPYGRLDYSYIGEFDILYGYGNYSGGSFNVDSPLNSMVKFLHFPKGMQLVSGSSGALTVTLTLSGSGSTEIYNTFLCAKTLNSTSRNEGNITVQYVDLTDGALGEDIYMALMSETATGATFDITVSDGANSCTYAFDRGAKYFYDAVIYHFKQADFSPVKPLQ